MLDDAELTLHQRNELEAGSRPLEVDLRGLSHSDEFDVLRELDPDEIARARSCRIVFSISDKDFLSRVIDQFLGFELDPSIDVVLELGYRDVADGSWLRSSIESIAKLAAELSLEPKLRSITVGVIISGRAIPFLHHVFDLAVRNGVAARFRMGTAGDAEVGGLDQTEVYHLVEFLEGLLAYSHVSQAEQAAYRMLIGELHEGTERRITGIRRPIDRIRVERSGIERIHGSDSSVDRPAWSLTGWSDFDSFEAVDMCRVQRGASSVARRLVLTLASPLGAEPFVRKTAQQLLAPYRRRIARRHFRQRIGQIVDAVIPLEGYWSENGKRKRVLICGWYGTETLGDKAILGGVVRSLEDVLGEVELVLVSLHPYVSEMTRRQMPELKNAAIVAPPEGASLAREADLVVFGGGPLMALGVLAEMQAIFEVAKASQVRTLIAGCGVGPLGQDWHNGSIRRILELTDLRIYRDNSSRQLAATIGVESKNDAVAEDPAFSWLAAQREALSVERNHEHPVLLLGLRDFPYRAYARQLDKRASCVAKSNYEQAVLEALSLLASSNPNLVIKPLPMCTNHFGHDDRWFYRRLFRPCKDLHDRLDVSLLGVELAPLEYCAEFRKADVALVMRFHSLVFALGLDLPAVAIDYTLGRGKVRALADRFNVPQQRLDELSAEFLARELQRLLDNPETQAPGFDPGFPNLIKSGIPILLEGHAV